MRMIISFLLLTLVLPPGFARAQSYLAQFDTPVEAQQNCPNDTVVWISTQKAVPPYKGAPKNPGIGGYVCKQQAINAGYSGLVTHITPLKKP